MTEFRVPHQTITRRGFLSITTLSVASMLGLLSGCTDQQQAQGQDTMLGDAVAQIYRSPTCSCCEQYANYLAQQDVATEIIEIEQINTIKQDLNIPQSMWSCHTMKIGNYYVEGHVPLEAVVRLLDEKPDIDGLAMPGMPAGSPGMGGTKQEPFTIFSIKDGLTQEYMKI